MFGESDHYCATQGHSGGQEVELCRTSIHNPRAKGKEASEQGSGISEDAMATSKGIKMDLGVRSNKVVCQMYVIRVCLFRNGRVHVRF